MFITKRVCSGSSGLCFMYICSLQNVCVQVHQAALKVQEGVIRVSVVLVVDTRQLTDRAVFELQVAKKPY